MITSLFTIQNCMVCTSANIEDICLFAWQTKGTPQDTLLPMPVRLTLTSLTNPTQLSHLAFHLSWLDFCHEVRHVEHFFPHKLNTNPHPQSQSDMYHCLSIILGQRGRPQTSLLNNNRLLAIRTFHLRLLIKSLHA